MPTISFRLDEYSPRQIAERLGQEGIFVWDGNYCVCLGKTSGHQQYIGGIHLPWRAVPEKAA